MVVCQFFQNFRIDLPPFEAGNADLADACKVLAAWNGRFDLDSRGAALFREFLSQYPQADYLGKQRRLLLNDVLALKKDNESKRRDALRELAALDQELGLL